MLFHCLNLLIHDLSVCILSWWSICMFQFSVSIIYLCLSDHLSYHIFRLKFSNIATIQLYMIDKSYWILLPIFKKEHIPIFNHQSFIETCLCYWWWSTTKSIFNVLNMFGVGGCVICVQYFTVKTDAYAYPPPPLFILLLDLYWSLFPSFSPPFSIFLLPSLPFLSPISISHSSTVYHPLPLFSLSLSISLLHWFSVFPFLFISGSLPSLVSSGSLHPLYSRSSLPPMLSYSLTLQLSSPTPPLSRPPLGSPTPLPTCVSSHIYLFSSVLSPHSLFRLSFYHSLPLPLSPSFPLFCFILSLPSLFSLPYLSPYFLPFTPSSLCQTPVLSHYLSLPPSSSLTPTSLSSTSLLSFYPSLYLPLILSSPNPISIFLSLCQSFFLSFSLFLSLFFSPISTFLSLPCFLSFPLSSFPHSNSLSHSLCLSLSFFIFLSLPTSVLINIFKPLPCQIALR